MFLAIIQAGLTADKGTKLAGIYLSGNPLQINQICNPSERLSCAFPVSFLQCIYLLLDHSLLYRDIIYINV